MTLPVPDVPLFTAGLAPADVADTLNAGLRDPLTFLLIPPTFRARRTTALSIVEGHQFVSWNQIDEDTYSGWGPSQTPSQAASRYVVQQAGQYAVTAMVSLSGTGATGLVLIPSLSKNGAPPSGFGSPGWEGVEAFMPTGASSQPKASSGYWEAYALPGEYFEIDLWYSTESAITAVDTTAGWQCAVEIVWMGV